MLPIGSLSLLRRERVRVRGEKRDNQLILGQILSRSQPGGFPFPERWLWPKCNPVGITAEFNIGDNLSSGDVYDL